MQKRWKIPEVEMTAVSHLQSELKIHQMLCQLLVQRDIDSFAKAKSFFRPQLSDLHSPWLMKDMAKAVSRVLKAFAQQEKILVFGDYDVDGTTSVAMMFQFLTRVNGSSNIDFYVPHRYLEGYGVSKKGIDYARERGITLIISLDCGIKSYELIVYAKQLGIDFIVCDHHLPEHILPPAEAILNPKQVDCNYPYKELCGCGVGFKLISALAERLNLDPGEVYPYLDLVATAIAADIVPITGENRVLAFYGLKRINDNPCVGIKALMELSGVQKEKPLDITNLVFMIAPRVNAAGRMDDASKAVQLFIERDHQKALQFAAMLHTDNHHRKETDASITEEALALIELDEILVGRKSTVLFQPHWHKGVVGIVASRLIEKYYRPTVVLTQSGDLVAGSARSVSGFDLYEAIHACREHLLGYGGHFAAAGLTLLPTKLDDFILKFEEVVSSTIHPDMLIPEIVIDGEVHFSDLRPSFYNIVSQMEPFGPGNLRPVFLTRNVTDYGWSRIVKEQHVRFYLRHGNCVFNGIGFNMKDKFHLLQLQKPLDVIYVLEENEWNNEKHLQLRVLDLRLSSQ